jgi:NADH:ubiquinone oxidoreductase subunit D
LLSRSAKIGIDARFTGYEFYHTLSYSLYLSSSGDCLDRYILRLNEINEIIHTTLARIILK